MLGFMDIICRISISQNHKASYKLLGIYSKSRIKASWYYCRLLATTYSKSLHFRCDTTMLHHCFSYVHAFAFPPKAI